jgi:heme oxygenase
MPRNFSRELNQAIRDDHIALNKLITARLPLCLPPHTDTPLLYAQGLIVFGSIYTVFEAQITRHLSNQVIQDRILKSLTLVEPPGLRRTGRIKKDLSDIQHRLQPNQWRCCNDISLKTAELADRITESLSASPHLIPAYAWTMYLAIFNGGRWIRMHLRDAGEAFWGGSAPLSFWEFDGECNGEDIEQQFKINFERAAELLTDEEWADVAQEAKRIFAMCSEIVGVLDENAMDTARQSVRTVQKGSGMGARLWVAIGYVGLLYLLGHFLRPLWQVCSSWSSSVLPMAAAKGTHSE